MQSHYWLETDLSVLAMISWDTRKIVGTWLHIIIGVMWIARPWGVKPLLGQFLTVIKKWEESVQFFYSACLIPSQLNNYVSCYAGFDGWWYTFEFEVWIFAVYDIVSLVTLRLACSIHLGRSNASTPGPWVGVTLGSAARYAYPALDASPVC